MRLRKGTVLSLLAAALPLLAFQAARDLVLEIPDTPVVPQAGTPTRWALVVGVSTYKNLPPRAQLRYAHRDAADYAEFLRSPQGGGLASSQVRLLTEERATVSAIRAAFQEWLQPSVGAKDVVYLFLAGHGVVGDGNETYFVANDSDPQNLHATGFSFRELNEAINGLRASLVVVVADACHSGSIGWTGSSESLNSAHSAFDSLGSKDRLTLKMLASRPTERSYEDVRWGGGHGVFTHALLDGLRGGAERDSDGVVRASELMDYISKVVPEQTGARQNPRIAGNFEPRLALALVSRPRKAGPQTGILSLRGPAGASVYLDNVYRGTIRPTGELRVEAVATGPRRLSVDLPGGQSFDQPVMVGTTPNAIDIEQAAGVSLLRLQSMIARGAILGNGGAWDYFRSEKFTSAQRPVAASIMASALESLGQDCVSDYVQSTRTNLKRAMLVRAVDAYTALRTMRPNDRALEARQRFCLGRAQIASNQFAEAEQSLRAALAIDKDFACAHNALGVALTRLGKANDARLAFERAAELTPQWSLPYFQIAQQLIANDKLKQAVPYLEKAADFNPNSVAVRWTLMRTYRVMGRRTEVERVGKELVALDPNYAPTYLELGLYYDQRGDSARAALAYDSYLVLAPNFGDSNAVRQRANQVRASAGRKPVELFP